jgi:hypothetical protein
MDFPPLSSLDLSALRWLKTSGAPSEFRLSAGDAPILVLRWPHERGTVATADSSAGAWTIARAGFLSPQIVLRKGGAPTPLARLTVHVSHHTIEVEGGASYGFQRAGLLLPAWKLFDANRTECLHIEPVREGRELAGGAVLVAPEAAKRPELVTLLALTWSFITLAWFEDEALVPFEDRTVGP